MACHHSLSTTTNQIHNMQQPSIYSRSRRRRQVSDAADGGSSGFDWMRDLFTMGGLVFFFRPVRVCVLHYSLRDVSQDGISLL